MSIFVCACSLFMNVRKSHAAACTAGGLVDMMYQAGPPIWVRPGLVDAGEGPRPDVEPAQVRRA